MYQVFLLQGLTNGDYNGSVTLKELKQHGDIGIGTFDGFRMRLPQSEIFADLDLTVDQSEDIGKIEKSK